MKIRQATEADLAQMMEIFQYARKFMAEHGNPNQWGPKSWPPEYLIRKDIAEHKSYVCVHEDKIVGTFFFDVGEKVEPTYCNITEGKWIKDGSYGVVHRLAGNGTVKGIGKFILDWAFQQCGHVRIDTHGDNVVLQNLLQKMGFTYCGVIYVAHDNAPRLAYEKL